MRSYSDSTTKPSRVTVWARLLMALLMGGLLIGLLYWAGLAPPLEPSAERPALRR